MGSKRIEAGGGEETRLLARCAMLSCLVLAVDQITKGIIVARVECPITVIPGFFNIVKVGNRGAAWGMFQGHTWPLLGISVLFLAGVVYFLRSLTEGWRERYYAFALVAGGVLGNSVDRIWRGGAVVDFLDFYIPGVYHWPAFNVADSAITIGVATYVLSSLMREPRGGRGGGSSDSAKECDDDEKE